MIFDFWRSAEPRPMPDAAEVRQALGAIMAAPRREADLMIVSTYFADTLAAVQRVYDSFGGRDRRRIKRELRRAHKAVDRKHRGMNG